jgi:peptide/nickel transport system substrate-binding protein
MTRTAFSCAGVLACLLIAGCGQASRHRPRTTDGGTATVLLGAAPDSLDPSISYSTEGVEALWATNLPLLTYRHAEGAAGTQLVPALADGLPSVSADGLTYSLRLRPGLRYSDGRPVRASDFRRGIERAIRLNWGGKLFFLQTIEGAAAYDARKAGAIAGIAADDTSGHITIRLTHPYGPFAYLLAFPAAAPLPRGTPMRPLPQSPPVGVGPYTITSIEAGHGFTLRRNPGFAALHIPGLATGHLSTIKFRVTANPLIEGEQVLRNRADVFDASDVIPPSLLPQIRASATRRFAPRAAEETLYFFMNTRERPFDRLEVRQAVAYAVDRRAIRRLASGFLTPDCYLLPAGIPGHPTAPCPYGTKPDLAKARKLIAAAGATGARVAVWGRSSNPFAQFAVYYASVLRDIGLRPTLKLIADNLYFATVGNPRTHAQTGYGEWAEDFPDPSDFYLLLDARSIQPQNTVNLSRTADPRIQAALERLGGRPGAADPAGWDALDRHAAARAYLDVVGHRSVPKFLSNRIDFGSAIVSPVYLGDVTSWRLVAGR